MLLELNASSSVATSDFTQSSLIVKNKDYYVMHYNCLLHGVERCYAEILAHDEKNYIEKTRCLSAEALKLYIRLVNRKGPVFRVNKLDYLEPCKTLLAIEELSHQSLIQKLDPNQALNKKVLETFTIDELRKIAGKKCIPKNITKSELCYLLQSHADYFECLKEIFAKEPMIFLAESCWNFLKFLYFGRLTENLSDFVIHEFGYINPEAVDTTKLTPRFSSYKAARQCFNAHLLYDEFRSIRDTMPADALASWFISKDTPRAELSPEAYEIYDRLVTRVGRIQERAGHLEQALNIYERSPAFAARERLIRILVKLGDHAGAVSICESLDPALYNEEENYVLGELKRKLAKTDRRTKAHHLLKNYAEVPLQWHEGEAVEQAALRHYKSCGWQGVHSENWLWNGLFGLLFWDIVYAQNHGAFHNPLQFSPSGLYQPHFFSSRMEQVNARLALLDNSVSASDYIQSVFLAKKGKTNPFIAWHDGTLDLIQKVIAHVPYIPLGKVLMQMTAGLATWSHGFPDLFLWNGSSYCFVEVKSKRDRIQPQQFNWITLFHKFGIECDIIRVIKADQP